MRLLSCALVLLLAEQLASAQGSIRLKTRVFTPVGEAAPTRALQPGPAMRRHYLILFRSYPGADLLAELGRRRIQVVAYVPENALMVAAAVLNLQGLDVIWSGPMDPSDKISPALSDPAVGAYLLMFQPDTQMAQNRDLVQARGFTVVDNLTLLAGQLVVTGAASGLPSLAALDQLAYILPASTELQNGDPVMACAGALTAAGPVAQYVQVDSGWNKDASGRVALQYFLDSLTPRMDETLVRSEIARAFAEWQRYANFTIAPGSAPNLTRSIDIQFARFAHGDPYPFDGPGGALAHTFYPAPDNVEPLAGDMHLDADESWHAGSTVDLYSVVLHEAGHALGLGHSDNPSAVMYPYYRQQTGLSPDDIAGVQALYGAPGGTVAAPTGGGGATTTTPPSTGTDTGAAPGKQPPDTVAPTLKIASPASSIVSLYTASISVSGTASDNVAVTAVRWTTSTGSAGTASGATSWSASIPLLVGDNTVTIRAYDAAGNSTWRSFTVVRH